MLDFTAFPGSNGCGDGGSRRHPLSCKVSELLVSTVPLLHGDMHGDTARSLKNVQKGVSPVPPLYSLSFLTTNCVSYRPSASQDDISQSGYTGRVDAAAP